METFQSFIDSHDLTTRETHMMTLAFVEIQKLEAENKRQRAELEADRARLEWMAKNNADIWEEGGRYRLQWWDVDEISQFQGELWRDNWRDAIDEAMRPCGEA